MKKSTQLAVLLCFVYSCVAAQTTAALDNSFSGNGLSTTDFSGSDRANAIVLDKENARFVTVGKTGSNVAIARYLIDGTLDTRFSDDGKQTIALPTISGPGIAEAFGVAIQVDNVGDEKITVVGTTRSTSSGTGYEYFIVRYKDNGDLDPNFSGDGKLVEGESSTDIFYGVAIDNLGRIIAVGQRYSDVGNQFSIRRYLPNGDIDLSFYGSTFGSTNYPAGIARAILLAPNGKIIVTGESNGDFMTIRLNEDGTLDNSFSGDGRVSTNLSGSTDFVRAATLQKDGKIVVAGASLVNGKYNIGMARYHIDGTPDDGFGIGGALYTPVGQGHDFANAVAIQDDEKIVVAGTTHINAYSYEVVEIDGTRHTINVPANDDILVARFNTSGFLDATFSGDGHTNISFTEGMSEEGNAMILQNDNKVLVAGKNKNGSNDDFAFCRLHGHYRFESLTNRLYTSFGNYDDRAYDIAIDAQRRIVIAGFSYNGLRKVIAVARYMKDGRLDTSFGNNGRMTYYTGGYDTIAYALTILSDGKILLAGTISNIDPNDKDFFVMRILADGSTDNTFDGDGMVKINLVGNDECNSMVLQPEGKIILCGNVIDVNDASKSVALVRLNANGTIDNTFDTDGKVYVTNAPEGKNARSVTVSAGKIYVCGIGNEGGGFIAMKFNDNGSLDNSFGGDGIVSIGGLLAGAQDIAVQADGKVILGGALGSDMAVVRLTTSGALDNTFAGDGIFTISAPSFAAVHSVILQADGKILAGGNFVDQLGRGELTYFNIELFRITTNGEFDKSFGNEGIFLFPKLGYTDDSFQSMVLNNSGRVYITGHYYNGYDTDMTLAIFEQCKVPLITLTHPAYDVNMVIVQPYEAATIEATNWVVGTGKVFYKASDGILLMPGFRADASTVFRAEINKTCSFVYDPDDLLQN
ncbi:3-coathanger stack domain-containing protein [Emticicia sp. C21]|uniref:3-coathanger stack domain-containing protein n=1 Tax=Emticicia sp. C21 TaxID=2302915 RepID=UPI0013145E02|nr:3-coathanger stack domain-containing protein [Emticicia sp. C21]